MAKKHLLIAAVACTAVLAAGCSSNKETEKATEAATKAAVTTEAATTEAETTAAAAATTETSEEAATEAENTAAAAATTEAAEEAATEAENTAAAAVTTEAAEEATTEAETAAVTEEDTTEAAEEAGESVGEVTDAEAATESLEGETEASTEVASDVVELGERPTYDALQYVTLGQYKGLEVTVAPVQEVTDEDIDGMVEAAIKDAGKLDTLQEGTVQEGDIANIDYEGKKDGVAFDGGTAQGYDLEIGSGTFIDGFEEGLVGKTIGDTVDLNLTFPENYGNSDLAGQEVVFTVTINSVQRMPEITDDLINDLTSGEYTTVEAYRQYQKEQLEETNKNNHENEIKTDLMQQLINTCTVNDYPEDLVTYVVNSNNNYYAQYANAYGYSLDDFISMYFGLDRETYDEQMETSVKQSLRQELILEAIAQQEGLTEISEEDYQSECERYAEGLGYDSVEDFQKAYTRTLIEQSIAMDRAMDLVYDNAIVTEEAETEAVSEAVEAATEGTESAAEVANSSAAQEEVAEAVTEAVTESETK